MNTPLAPRDIDAKRLVRDYGGRARLLALLAKHDATVTDRLSARGIDKWMQRGKILGDWLLAISAMHTAEGGGVLDLAKYIPPK